MAGTTPNYEALTKAVADTVALPKQNAVLILGFLYGGGEPPAPGGNYKRIIQNSMMEWGPNGAILHSLIDEPTVDALPRLEFNLVPKVPGLNKVYIDMNLTAGYIELGTVEVDGITKHTIRIDSTGIKLGAGTPQAVLLASAADKYNGHVHAGDTLGAHLTAARYAQATITDLVKGPLVFLAVEMGILGNSISLSFNGSTDTVATVAAAWNVANPTNLVTYQGDGTIIPVAGAVNLVGGVDVPAGIANGWGFATQAEFTAHMKALTKLQQDVKNLMAAAYPRMTSADMG